MNSFHALFEDKGINEEETKNETKYTYEAGSVPPWVKDNLAEIHRPGVSTPIRYTYTTDGLNRVRTATDARSHTTTYGYDGAGNLVSIGYPSTTLEDGSTQLAAETFAYQRSSRSDDLGSGECSYAARLICCWGRLTRRPDLLDWDNLPLDPYPRSHPGEATDAPQWLIHAEAVA